MIANLFYLTLGSDLLSLDFIEVQFKHNKRLVFKVERFTHETIKRCFLNNPSIIQPFYVIGQHESHSEKRIHHGMSYILNLSWYYFWASFPLDSVKMFSKSHSCSKGFNCLGFTLWAIILKIFPKINRTNEFICFQCNHSTSVCSFPY